MSIRHPHEKVLYFTQETFLWFYSFPCLINQRVDQKEAGMQTAMQRAQSPKFPYQQVGYTPIVVATEDCSVDKFEKCFKKIPGVACPCTTRQVIQGNILTRLV
jgi:hypothetical protein